MSFGLTTFAPTDVHNIEQGYRITFEQEIAEAPTWPAQLIAGIPMKGTKETYWWPEQTVEVQPREKSGGDITYMTLRWANRSITVQPYGVGLKIQRYQEHDLKAFAAIDTGASFGEQCGRKAAMFVPRGIKYLIQFGGDVTKVDCWDGEALFSTNHKITSGSSYRFSNTFTGMELTPINLAAAMAYVSQVEDGTGDYLGLERSITLVTGSTKRARQEQLLNTEWFTDLFNATNAAAAQNTFYKGKWGFNTPIASPYFDFAPKKWWLFSTTWKVPEQAPLHMPELEPFNLTSYSNLSHIELARLEELEYHFKGRIGFQGGMPHRVYQFDGDGAQVDPKMAAILAAM